MPMHLYPCFNAARSISFLSSLKTFRLPVESGFGLTLDIHKLAVGQECKCASENISSHNPKNSRLIILTHPIKRFPKRDVIILLLNLDGGSTRTGVAGARLTRLPILQLFLERGHLGF